MPKQEAPSHRIEVSRDGSLRVRRADGTLDFFAPVTSGSEHDPLPIGDWKVTGGQLDARRSTTTRTCSGTPTRRTPRRKIQPGPNNPVGVVWIDINKEHYGIHGTPEPSDASATRSRTAACA